MFLSYQQLYMRAGSARSRPRALQALHCPVTCFTGSATLAILQVAGLGGIWQIHRITRPRPLSMPPLPRFTGSRPTRLQAVRTARSLHHCVQRRNITAGLMRFATSSLLRLRTDLPSLLLADCKLSIRKSWATVTSLPSSQAAAKCRKLLARSMSSTSTIRTRESHARPNRPDAAACLMSECTTIVYTTTSQLVRRCKNSMSRALPREFCSRYSSVNETLPGTFWPARARYSRA